MIQLHIMTLAIDLGIGRAAVFSSCLQHGGVCVNVCVWVWGGGLLQCRPQLYSDIKTLTPRAPE